MDTQTKTSPNTQETKAHPWRICGIGKHLVREHVVNVPPSKKHPDGTKATWHEHCALNPSHRDELSFAEVQHISNAYFSDLSGPPTAGVLKFDHADEYDHLKITKQFYRKESKDCLIIPSQWTIFINTITAYRQIHHAIQLHFNSNTNYMCV